MSALHSKTEDLIAGLVSAISVQNCAHLSGMSGTRPGMTRSNPRVPIKTALAPIGLTEFVCDFDRFDPFGVLVAELGRGTQPQRIAERIADDLAGIFSGEDSLRMQRGRHVDAFSVIVGAEEIDIFCGQIGADALQKVAQIRTGPLA